MRSRGFGYARQDWYSLCSRHQDYNIKCRLCRTGTWENSIITRLSQFFYRVCPKLWRKWANRLGDLDS